MLRELGETYFSLVLQDYNRELRSIGRTLRDLLANLDGLHPHIMSRDHLMPGCGSVLPSVRVTPNQDGRLVLYVHQSRKDLCYFTAGIITAAAKMLYNQNVNIDLQFSNNSNTANAGDSTDKDKSGDTEGEGTDNAQSSRLSLDLINYTMILDISKDSLDNASAQKDTLDNTSIQNMQNETITKSSSQKEIPSKTSERTEKESMNTTKKMEIKTSIEKEINSETSKSSEWTSKNPLDLQVSVKTLNKSFPFHMVLDTELKITELGHTLLKLISPAIFNKHGAHFSNYFR